MGYKQEALPKHKSPNTSAIGVIASASLADPYYFPMMDTLFSSIERLGYRIHYCRLDTTYGYRTNAKVIGDLRDQVEGVIFVGNFNIPKEDLKNFIDIKVPVVSLVGNMDVPQVPHIIIDNYKGAYEITRYLIDKGHRKIAHIMAHRTFIHSIERLNGYKKALEDCNIELREDLITVGNFTFEESYQCSLNLIDSKKDFTAVFCYNDIIATAFAKAARERNLSIPKDISVVGFDDITFENPISKDLMLFTTMRQPRREMAQCAVNVLMQKIHGMEVHLIEKFAPVLIERNTVKEIFGDK